MKTSGLSHGCPSKLLFRGVRQARGEDPDHRGDVVYTVECGCEWVQGGWFRCVGPHTARMYGRLEVRRHGAQLSMCRLVHEASADISLKVCRLASIFAINDDAEYITTATPPAHRIPDLAVTPVTMRSGLAPSPDAVPKFLSTPTPSAATIPLLLTYRVCLSLRFTP